MCYQPGVDNLPIWQEFKELVNSFPEMSAKKHAFFQQLALYLPDVSLKLESLDGGSIHLLEEEENQIAITYRNGVVMIQNKKFRGFEDCFRAIPFIAEILHS
jgi:hypothetical protein